MKLFAKSLALLLFVFSNTAFGQWSKEVDSLINTAEQLENDSLKVARYGTLFEKLMYTDSDRAYTYAKLENNLASKLGYRKGIAASNLHFGTYHENIGQIDSARIYYLKSKELFRQMNSPKGELFINHALAGLEKKLGNYDQALAYHHGNIALYELPENEQSDLKGFNKIGAEYQGLAEIYKEKGNYKLALEQALKALRFFEGIEHTRRTGGALQELGVIEHKQRNYKSAIDYALRAYDIFKEHDYNDYQSHTAIDIGMSFLALKEYDKAIAYFEDALDIGREFKFIDAEAAALVYLGVTNRELQNYELSRNYLTYGLQLHESLGFKNELARDYNEIARLELDLGNTENAIRMAEKAMTISESIGALHNLSDSYEIRSEAYEKQDNTRQALSNYKRYKQTNDSIFNVTKSQQIAELKTIYDTEKKEQQIAIQKIQIDLLEQRAEINNLQRLLLAGGLVLALLGFYGIRQKMKRNKVIRQKLDAELAFKKKELTTHALHLAKKNEVLEGLKQQAKEFKQEAESTRGYTQLIRTIDFDLQDDNNWKNFARYFEEVHKDFNINVKKKYPEVTSSELRLLALLKMNLSSKEIASILNISQEGIKKARYRLRKKLEISKEESLQDLVLSL
ncbi:MAG: tetratricopeptide repeat protein [Flavobacteriaceae bacterium]